MDGAAVATMLVGMVIIWGGLAASVIHAVRSHRRGR
jgi:hypothetical protein